METAEGIGAAQTEEHKTGRGEMELGYLGQQIETFFECPFILRKFT
jgi:hypothetical protein